MWGWAGVLATHYITTIMFNINFSFVFVLRVIAVIVGHYLCSASKYKLYHLTVNEQVELNLLKKQNKNTAILHVLFIIQTHK